jgi:hypothetical protein
MRNLHLPTSLDCLRRRASGLTPELVRLSDAVGDTLSAATSAATSTANDTARRISRKVRSQRTHPRKRRWALVTLAGTGIVLGLVARRRTTERPAAFRSEADVAGRPALWSSANPAIDDDTPIDETHVDGTPIDDKQVMAPNAFTLADLAVTSAQSAT